MEYKSRRATTDPTSNWQSATSNPDVLQNISYCTPQEAGEYIIPGATASTVIAMILLIYAYIYQCAPCI
jgi:hypothetical protein